MKQFNYLGAWLQCLLQLSPPNGLIHVGAGRGNAEQYPFDSMPRLLVVEADRQRVLRLQAQLEGHANCQVVEAVLAGDPGEADYFRLTQVNESGLCPPVALQAMWPNIKAVHTDKRQVTTLQVQMSQVVDAKAFNWAMIDCLPAGEVLRGAGDLPRQWDVLVVRALRDASASVRNPGMGVSAICQDLAAHGLKLTAMEEENHPQVVRALFVRTQRNQLDAELSKLIAENVELTRTGAEARARRDAEERAKIEVRAERDTLARDVAALAADRDQLAVRRDAEERAKIEVLAQRDALARDAVALAAARDQLAALVEDQKNALLSQRQRIQQLEAGNQESVERQQMLQDEFVKAEVQIELIKDLLLREPEL